MNTTTTSFPEIVPALQRASLELREAAPPATLLPAIHRQLARQRMARRRDSSRWLAWTGWATGTCAAAMLAWVAIGALPEEGAATAEAPASSGFVTLANEDTWQQAAKAEPGRVWVVSTDIPQSRLAALGLPFDPARAADRVPAQLLVHVSGDVLAVRITR